MGLLEGAAIALVSLLIGRFLPGRRRTPKTPEPPKPVCGCTHHYAVHDPKTGRCKAGIKDPDRRGNYLSCACVRYTGPEPLPSYFAPEVTP